MTCHCRTSFYGEYKCYGSGARNTTRVNWSHQLTLDEATPFITQTWINGQDWIRSNPTHFKKPSFPLKNEGDGLESLDGFVKRTNLSSSMIVNSHASIVQVSYLNWFYLGPLTVYILAFFN